ncbi:MAG TPA: hypothetical protein VJV97_04225 [Gemmatimonadaceae bacterium]|nr:hypothetical protein [Gemmatimonadaceae bacterium]
MWLLFAGFALSLAYGACAATVIYAVTDEATTQEFVTAYVASFNVLITLGIVTATALIVRYAQNLYRLQSRQRLMARNCVKQSTPNTNAAITA